ncbi:hypothetical protein ACQRXC_27485 (plasmid) [Niallia taxi]|uniref:Uncharacterized protein n=1 Tax=Niallia taxi TaxID=2499688 RepID=A0A437K2V0_9BACI|nr:hypothetical protein [Niallia taxi]MDK8643917.1 hypothetical protein [Niallia taxi]MED4057800.1 hypothetical protein [Niallia taxi]RVT56364.1 hypothetical protein EM808_27655 [Niallia taxi]
MVDKKAVKILFKRYWSTTGWTNTQLSIKELDYAKEARIMFEPIELSHDEIIHNVNELVNILDLKEIIEQFIASLSTRRLDLRSALGSYIVGKHLLKHTFTGAESYCIYCGSYSSKTQERQDLNILNFERFKWGGIRHLDPLYIAFDLNQYTNSEKLVPTSEDYEILNKILIAINELPPEGKIRDLEKALTKIIKSNKEEREVLLQILGYCSILSNKEYPGFINKFIPFVEREEPNHYKNDWTYPVCFWTGKNGLNREALKIIFPNAIESVN